jgi:hypothetical protein
MDPQIPHGSGMNQIVVKVKSRIQIYFKVKHREL